MDYETRCGITGKVIPPEDAGLCNNAEGCDNCCHYEEDEDLPTGSTIVFLKWMFTIIAAVLFVVIVVSMVKAEEIPDEKAIMCVIGEAEGEGYEGMLAVAEAIRNQGTLQGVYGCNAPRIKKGMYSNKIFNMARAVWISSAGHGDITKGATHWEGTSFKTPYWAKDMIVTATIGRQRFYKEN